MFQNKMASIPLLPLIYQNYVQNILQKIYTKLIANNSQSESKIVVNQA